MTNINNQLKKQNQPSPPFGNVGIIFLNLTSCCQRMKVSLGDNERKIWINCKVLEKVTVSFVAQSLINGKMQGLSQFLARVVCEAR